MSIYVKEIKRQSRVILAIEAENKEEANGLFKEWLEDDENDEDLNCMLSEREHDIETWLSVTDEKTMKDTDFKADFLIAISNSPKEPRYDLYFIYEYDNGHRYIKSYKGIIMAKMLEIIASINEEYILHPRAGAPMGAFKDASERNVDVVSYLVTKRKETANG